MTKKELRALSVEALTKALARLEAHGDHEAHQEITTFLERIRISVGVFKEEAYDAQAFWKWRCPICHQGGCTGYMNVGDAHSERDKHVCPGRPCN